MSKNLLALLVASGSFSIALLLANSSQAAPIFSENLERAIFHAPIISSLSVTSPSLNWTEGQQNPILHSLGCSCATCTQSSQTDASVGN